MQAFYCVTRSPQRGSTETLSSRHALFTTFRSSRKFEMQYRLQMARRRPIMTCGYHTVDGAARDLKVGLCWLFLFAGGAKWDEGAAQVQRLLKRDRNNTQDVLSAAEEAFSTPAAPVDTKRCAHDTKKRYPPIIDKSLWSPDDSSQPRLVQGKRGERAFDERCYRDQGGAPFLYSERCCPQARSLGEDQSFQCEQRCCPGRIHLALLQIDVCRDARIPLRSRLFTGASRRMHPSSEPGVHTPIHAGSR